MAKLIIRKKIGRDNSFTSELPTSSKKSNDIDADYRSRIEKTYNKSNFPYLGSSGEESFNLNEHEFQSGKESPCISTVKKKSKSQNDKLSEKDFEHTASPNFSGESTKKFYIELN